MKYAGLTFQICTFSLYVYEWLYHIMLKLDLKKYDTEKQIKCKKENS